MSLESVFRLSLIMNMIDNLSGPMASVASQVGADVSKLDALSSTFGGMTKAGTAMQTAGLQITEAVLSPVEATFETRRAIGELASLAVKDLGAIEDAARAFSDQWAGTTKADFISAAYDIKSGIASLTDKGIAQYTELSGLTAKATKSTIGEMTSLFATGYGIYKDYYDDLTDLEFGEMFSAGIARSVQQFKTDGSQMASAIQTLGASATSANVPLEEQLSILGMLQATMGGSEAGTKYKAFLQSAAKAGDALGLSFLDANGQLLSMPEILDALRGKFGETMDAAEKMELQKAFGTSEAVALIDLLYNKTDDLQGNILDMYDALGSGTSVATEMANAINETEPERFERLTQHIQNVKESISNSLLPAVNDLMSVGENVLTKVGSWIEENQELVRVIMTIVFAIGGFLAIAGTVITVVGGVGLVITKTVSAFKILKAGFWIARAALGPLISSVWSFTAALLANPVTWIVIGIVALVAAIVLLYNKCEGFRNLVNGIFGVVRTAFSNGIEGVKQLVTNAVSWFLESGKKVVTTFAEGITGGFSSAVNAVKNGLQNIRNMLPFSDAKEGPLSTLTLSGQRTMTTYASGLEEATNVPAQTMEKSLGMANNVIEKATFNPAIEPIEGNTAQEISTEKPRPNLNRKPVKKVSLSNDAKGKDNSNGSSGDGDDTKQVIIQKLLIPVDLKKIKDLHQLLALLKEVEDFAEANAGESLEWDSEAMPSPA